MEPIPETPQKHFLNRVTKFSKILSLILFVTLPIVALYIGYKSGAEDTLSSQESILEEARPTSITSSSWAKISEVPTASDYYVIGSSLSSLDYYSNGDAVKARNSFSKNIENIAVDVPTFVVWSGSHAPWPRLAKDKNNVYYHGRPIIGVDLDTFTPLLDPYDATVGYFAKDSQHVYKLRFASKGESAGMIVPNADPASFAVVSWVFAKDKNTVWSGRGGGGLTGLAVVEGADAPTFSVVLLKDKPTSYFKDKNYVYWLESIIPGADPATFVVDSLVEEDLCPNSLCPAEYRAHDSLHSYQGSKIVR